MNKRLIDAFRMGLHDVQPGLPFAIERRVNQPVASGQFRQVETASLDGSDKIHEKIVRENGSEGGNGSTLANAYVFPGGPPPMEHRKPTPTLPNLPMVPVASTFRSSTTSEEPAALVQTARHKALDTFRVTRQRRLEVVSPGFSRSDRPRPSIGKRPTRSQSNRLTEGLPGRTFREYAHGRP